MPFDSTDLNFVYGRMDAWCRGIGEVFNVVDNINNLFPSPVVRVESRYRGISLDVCGVQLLFFPNWDVDSLDANLDKLHTLNDFVWDLSRVSAL